MAYRQGGKGNFYDNQERSQTSFKYIQMASLLTLAMILKIRAEVDPIGRMSLIKKHKCGTNVQNLTGHESNPSLAPGRWAILPLCYVPPFYECILWFNMKVLIGLDFYPKHQPPPLKTNFGLGLLPTTNQPQPKL